MVKLTHTQQNGGCSTRDVLVMWCGALRLGGLGAIQAFRFRRTLFRQPLVKHLTAAQGTARTSQAPSNSMRALSTWRPSITASSTSAAATCTCMR